MKPEVIIAGAGLGSGEISRETRSVLQKCSRVFLFSLPEPFENRLRGVFKRSETLKRKQEMEWNRWESQALKRIVACARKGLRVGVVMTGHPLVYNPGDNLTRLCARAKISYQILPALNFYDHALILLEPHVRVRRDILSNPMLICRAEDIAGRANPMNRHASTFVACLFTLGLGKHYDAPHLKPLFAKLNKVYGKNWPCYMVQMGDTLGDHPGQVVQMPLQDLPKRWIEISDMSTLFIPRRP